MKLFLTAAGFSIHAGVTAEPNKRERSARHVLKVLIVMASRMCSFEPLSYYSRK